MEKSCMRLIASWSGGKDGCLAVYKAMRAGNEVVCLLNFVSRGSGRCCFHGMRPSLLRLQSRLIRIPLRLRTVTDDMENYEKEFKSAVRELRRSRGVEGMVFGDIYLDEHREWVERVCREVNLRAVEPLWGRDPAEVIGEFVRRGFKAVVVSCKADVLGRDFLGRTVDRDLIEELRQRGLCPCGENGEYHTFVIDGPMFRSGIRLLRSRRALRHSFWKYWSLDIEEWGTGRR